MLNFHHFQKEIQFQLNPAGSALGIVKDKLPKELTLNSPKNSMIRTHAQF